MSGRKKVESKCVGVERFLRNLNINEFGVGKELKTR